MTIGAPAHFGSAVLYSIYTDLSIFPARLSIAPKIRTFRKVTEQDEKVLKIRNNPETPQETLNPVHLTFPSECFQTDWDDAEE